VNKERWFKLSLAQQLGNIGSEVARAKDWQLRGDEGSCQQALTRALELLDITLDDTRWHTGGRVRELARLREVVADWYSQQGAYDVQPQVLEDYCVCLSLAVH